jgi:adenosine deaminase
MSFEQSNQSNRKNHFQSFARDGANFSINTDDPTVTGTQLDDEFKLLHSWGLRESTFTSAVSL